MVVRMQVPDATTQKRKRGGQPGNSNRLRHGLYSRTWLAQRDESRTLRRRTRHLIVKLHMIARSRNTLARQRMRAVPAPAANAFDSRPFFARRRLASAIDCARIRGPT
jgi:hypothetical protein